MEQELTTLPEQMRSRPVFNGVRVAYNHGILCFSISQFDMNILTLLLELVSLSFSHVTNYFSTQYLNIYNHLISHTPNRMTAILFLNC